MAQPVASAELGTWRGENVRLDQVLDALADLRRGEQRTATRASVTNLVLVAHDQAEVDQACEAVHHLGRRHPGRNIVLVPRPDDPHAGLDATVLLHGSVAGGHPVWSEDVCLTVRGPAARWLHSLIEPLTLPDLPVVAWYVSGLPDPGDPLLLAVDRLVVDAGTLDPAAAGDLERLMRRHFVLDLCWARLRPWRRALAEQFEQPGARPFLRGVRAVEAAGPPWPRLLLAGWAASRLGLARAAVALAEGPDPAIRLTAAADGEEAVFAAQLGESAAGAPVVRAWSTRRHAARRGDLLALPEDPVAWALGLLLTRVARDLVHGQALRVAVGFAG